MWYFAGGVVLVILGFYMLFKRTNIDNFKAKEAKRYLFGFNEINDEWSSNGRVYTNGIALIEDKKTGKKKFIKQAELCDIGILS